MDRSLESTNQLSLSLLSPCSPKQQKQANPNMPSSYTKAYTSKTRSGTIYLIISSSLGVGALSIPYMIHLTGLILGIFYIILGLIITCYAVYCLIEVSKVTGRYTFYGIGEYLYGNIFGKLCEASLCLSCYIIFVNYIDFLGRLPRHFSEYTEPDSNLTLDDLLWMGVFTILILPIAYFRWIFFLVHTCKLTILGGVVMLGIIMYEVFSMRDDVSNRISAALSEVPFSHADSLKDFLTPFSIVILAFDCQSNVLSVYQDLKDRDSLKAMKLIGSSLSVVNIYYIILGFFGYILFYKETFTYNLIFGKFNSGDIAIYIVISR
jgi:amino acid permease